MSSTDIIDFVETDKVHFETDPVHFGTNFVKSDAFKDMFREGMMLVEEAAGYLDGEGRTESQKLHRNLGLTYASESMRLTTRLMQLASWLLVHRAVAEEEISAKQASQEKNRVKLTKMESPSHPTEFEAMPQGLKELIERAARMHERIFHLDNIMSEEAMNTQNLESPVANQHMLLRSAFNI